MRSRFVWYKGDIELVVLKEKREPKMKTFADALEAAEKVSTKKEKFAALSGMIPDHQRLIVEALNPYRVFHVKKWEDQPERHRKEDAAIGCFYALLDNLHKGKLTGDAARAAVQDTLSWYTRRTAKYLARVLKKDLDCGAQLKTFKKVYPKLNIPTFKVMLAEKMDEKYKWTFPCIAEYKYDGLRLISFVSKDGVTYLSRSGKPSNFCNGLFDDELMKMMEEAGKPIVVDGEVLGSSFQESAMAKGRKNVEAKKKLCYTAFDWMTMDEWFNGSAIRRQGARTNTLLHMIHSLELKKVKNTAYIYVDNLDEAKKFYGEALKAGYEGLIIKDVDAKYEWKRSDAWTKWKPVQTFDLKLVEVIKGKGKYSNTCGALLLKGKDENGNKIDTKMGSGMSDAVRELFWRNRNSYIGKTIEVEAQEMTKAKGSETFSLRFPVFVKIRGDK